MCMLSVCVCLCVVSPWVRESCVLQPENLCPPHARQHPLPAEPPAQGSTGEGGGGGGSDRRH